MREPTEDQWWITGFNPYTVGKANVHKQVMIASVDFSEYTDANGDNMMLDAFVDGLGKRLNEQKYIMADTDNHIVWYMWYSEVLA